MQIVNLNGEARQSLGKASNNILRKEGRVPAVIYGGNENIHFTTTPKELKSLVYTPDFKLAEISVGENTYKTIVKDIQFHPVTDEILHIDFQQLTDKRKVNVSLPVRFKGVSPGVKNGGTFIQSLRKVKVKVDPEFLVDELIADISELKLGFAVRVRDLVVGEGIEIMASGATPLASVQVPRALKTEEEEAAEAAEALALLGGEETEEGEATEGEGEGEK